VKLHPCAQMGCGANITPERHYCARHQSLEDAYRKRQAAGSAARWAAHSESSPEWAAMIHSPAWRKVRAEFLEEHPLCACGCMGKATTVDHLRPGDMEHALDPDYLQALTWRCHLRKSARDSHAARGVRT